MIRLIFSVSSREMIYFMIIDRYIFYRDRKTQVYVRCLPKPEKLLNIQKGLDRIFTFTEEELKEYESCQSEKDLSKMVIKDAKLKACRLILERESPNNENLLNLIKDKEVITTEGFQA